MKTALNPLKTLHLKIGKITTNTYLRSATINWATRNVPGVNIRFFFKVAIYFRQGGLPFNFSSYIYIDLFWHHLALKLTYKSSLIAVNLLENSLCLTQPTEKQRNETKHLEFICILVVGAKGIHYTRKKENILASPEKRFYLLQARLMNSWEYVWFYF